MKTKRKRLCGFLLSVVITITFCLPAAAGESSAAPAVSTSANYILHTVKAPQVGTVGGEWAIIGLARSGHDVPQEYWDGYYASVEEYTAAHKGILHTRKYTEYSRVVLALTAIGADPTDVAGYNLLTPLGDFEKTLFQGINGPIWALIVLDSSGYPTPVNAEAKTQATRQMYIDEILRRQLSDGGWNLINEGGDGQADPDVTAMALQALAKYQTQAAVKTAIDKALVCLSCMQDANGGYSGWNDTSSESAAQVIIALCELGIELTDDRFVKNGNSLLDYLLSFQKPDGSFTHTADGSTGSQIASEQGLCGIVAAMRAAESRNSLYRMSDCTIRISPESVIIGLPGKHADVKKTSIAASGTSFSDVVDHDNRTAIEALADRGVITGYDSGTFGPDETVTRAQFAAMVVRALGLPAQKTGVFADVAHDAWYASYVGSAYAYGITTGKTETIFDPNSTITRQEAAVMVARAAELCGLNTEFGSPEIRNTLAPFGDYVTISAWAQESMAFCYIEEIMDQSELNTEPFRPILRCEVAQMLYNLLGSAKLL